MSMFVKNKTPLHFPPIGGVLCLLFVLGLAACARTPDQQVVHDLEEALTDLYEEADVDAYMQRLDFGSPLDSVHYALYSEVIRQQLQREGHEQKVVSWRVSEVNFQHDTLAMVFYTLYLANGDSLCKGQQMVCADGEWKLRMKD